jgi:hypothetical protein
MPDVFANITQAPPEALEVIANVLDRDAGRDSAAAGDAAGVLK